MLHPIQPRQSGAHLTQLDPEATDLDLLVGAPHIVQLPIWAPRHQIPGAIHSRARRPERTRHETRRGQSCPPPVAEALAGAGHIKVPDHTRRYRPQPCVQHEERKVRKRDAHRADVAVDVGIDDLPVRRMHRRLGGSVQVQQSGRRVGVAPRLKPLWLKGFTGEHHGFKRQLTPALGCPCIGGLQCVKSRRCLTQNGDLLGGEQRVELFR